MPPIIALQIIRTFWTKKSRGGAGAQKRNAVPLALPIQPEAGKFSFEIFFFGEANGFSSPIELNARAQGNEVRETHESFAYSWIDVSCDWNHETETLYLRYSNQNGGAPKPIFRDEFGNEKPIRRELLVAANTWSRLRWIERLTDRDTGAWWYQHTVVNLAHFQVVIDSDVFLNSSPAHEFVSLPRLR